MAGIGFEIRKMSQEDTFIGDLKAFAYASVVSSGPWITSILCLSFIWTFSFQADIGYLKLLRVTVVYTYAYSLITTGMIQFVITRFLADRLYVKQKNIFLPTYVGLMLFTIATQGLTAIIFYSYSGLDIYFTITAVVLYITVSCIWQTMIFLSASRDYLSIVASFFFGGLISFVFAVTLGDSYGFTGSLMGFTVGQILILFFLMHRVFYEFDSMVVCSFDFFREMGKRYKLLLIGVFYYLAVWIDKIIYWYSPGGEHIGSLFYSHYPYDSCVFLAYLTIIPALSHFLIDVETNFYESYRGFYGAIINKGAYAEIDDKRRDMAKTTWEMLSRMIVLQTVVLALYLFYSPYFSQFLNLEEEFLSVIIAAGIGAYFHAFLLVVLILILYFDQQLKGLILSIFFFVTNVLFTSYVINYAPDYMGYGYAASTFLSLIFGILLLSNIMKNIEYLTFVQQPKGKPTLPKQSLMDLRSVAPSGTGRLPE